MRQERLLFLVDPGADLPFNDDELQRNVKERPRWRRTWRRFHRTAFFGCYFHHFYEFVKRKLPGRI